MDIMSTNPRLLKLFNEKLTYLLCYIYKNGGNEYKPIDFRSDQSYLIPECKNQGEFNRIMEALISKGWISYVDKTPDRGGPVRYRGIKLTESGITEAEKSLPQVPMIGLVNQDITTGDPAIDDKINHAKKLFFSEPPTIDNMRSACETLSFILEPLRDELSPAITVADVNDFFQLVNKFDIRHNKAAVSRLIYSEQLEWVFYSLLNTIYTYTKLKKRLKG